MNTELLKKIESRCEEVGDCLEWQGHVSSGGSPRIWHEGKTQSARKLILQASGKPSEVPPSYPACFEGPQQFDGWRDSARRVREESNPCDDCTAEYAARMRDEGRCDREYVQERFVINKGKKRIGVVA